LGHKKRAQILLLTALFLLTALPASAIFPIVEDVRDDLDVKEMEIETYRDTPFTGMFRLEEGEEPVVFSVVKEPKKGSVTVAEDGVTFTYTPNAGKTGRDKFSVVATDANGRTGEPEEMEVVIRKRSTSVTYSDMSGHSACLSAVILAEEGVYTGRQVGGTWLFEPEESITRSEFLALAMRVCGISIPEDVTVTGFADDGAIPAWVKGCAGAAVHHGIINGITYADGVHFCADEPVTLEEAAVMMDRLLDVADVELSGENSGCENWALQSVANMEAVNIVPVGSFSSGAKVITRGETAQMLTAAMDHIAENTTQNNTFFSWIGE